MTLPTWSIDIRDATRVNGSSGKPPLTTKTTCTAASWYDARVWAAKQYGIDAMDSRMLVVPAPTTPEENRGKR